MNIAPDSPTRPAFRYFGGKWRLAPWIISFFPPHANYVEPCGGAASVLLQKPRSTLETLNDLNGHIVNFFRVLREQPDELIHLIRMTPWARDEFEFCRTPSDDPLENARRFYASAVMVRNRSPFDPTTGWRAFTDGRKPYSLISAQITDSNTEYLYDIARRFQAVQIENRDFLTIIDAYDNDGALIYFDPPYVMETRSGRGYQHEFTDSLHTQAAELLRNCQGYVVVSGYACALYANLYEAHGWERHDTESQVDDAKGGTRTESVWLSPRTSQALALPKQTSLFL